MKTPISLLIATGLCAFAFSPILRAQSPDVIEANFATLPDKRWPGRLVVGGKTLDGFVAIGEEAHSDASWTVRVFQSGSVPTLQIRAQWRVIDAATEWISTLVNNSAEPSARVTELRLLAASWPTRGPDADSGSVTHSSQNTLRSTPPISSPGGTTTAPLAQSKLLERSSKRSPLQSPKLAAAYSSNTSVATDRGAATAPLFCAFSALPV